MNFDSDNSDLDRLDAAREARWERHVAARRAMPYNHPDAPGPDYSEAGLADDTEEGGL